MVFSPITNDTDLLVRYQMLMNLAKESCAAKCVGATENGLVLMCNTRDEILSAASICERWANGRPVRSMALPGGFVPDDVLPQNGYIGVSITGETKSIFDREKIIKAMGVN